MRWALCLAVLLAAAPTAAAESASGQLRASGGLVLPAETTLGSSPLAMFVPDALDMGNVTGRFPRAEVKLFEDSYVSATVGDHKPMLVVETNRPTWTSTELTVSVSPAREGWVGMRPQAGAATESVGVPVEVTVAARWSVGNGAGSEDQPHQPYHLVHVGAASLGRTTSDWTYTGAGSLKVLGPTVTLTSRENSTTIETGEMQDPQNPGRTLLRWLVLEFDAGDVVASAAATQVVSGEADATWDGPMRLHRASGTLASGTRTWSADGSSETIDGAFEATLQPIGSGDAIDVLLAGDLRSSSLTSRAVIAAGPADAGATTILLIAGAAVAVAAGAIIHKRRREPTSPALSADEYAQLADRAADAEQYEDAAAWAQEARALSPTSRRLALDHAYYVWMTGDWSRARHLLQDPLLDADPDASLLLTRIHLKHGTEDEAARSLCRALAVSPAVLLDVEGDPELDRLVRRPDVGRAIREARRKLE